jgi:ubiquinone/menaquinone biosynthesis C-methylase UbiE
MLEAERILSEYARRSAEIDPDLYAATNPAALFIRQTLERALIAELMSSGTLPLARRRILDAGCGAGQWLADLETWGARRERLAGLDLVPDRVEQARARLPGADIRQGDAAELPWEDESFDVVLQSMMFSSILDPSVKTAVAAEMTRVLRPGGLVLWYDFFTNNPRNPNVRGVRKSEVRDLFPAFDLRWRRVTLAPPLIRFLAPRARALAAALQALRVFDTHALALLRTRA